MDINLLKASSLLGVIDRREVVRAAQSALFDPIDEDVMGIALCDEEDVDCIEQALEKLFKLRNVDTMSMREALEFYARSVCAQIIDGTLSPVLGADRISKVAIESAPDGYVELDPFIYASSEAESRPEDKAFFENAILGEARRMMAHS